MFLTPGGGQNYVTFLRASSSGVQAGQGSYISVELNNTAPGAVALAVNQCVNGVVTQLMGGGMYILPNQENILRSVVLGNVLWVLFNNVNVVSINIPQTTGSPGVGAYGSQPGSLEEHAQNGSRPRRRRNACSFRFLAARTAPFALSTW